MQEKSLSPKKLRIVLVFLAIIGGLIHWLSEVFTIVLTPSVKPTVLIKVSGIPQKGEYTTFDFQHDLIGPQYVLLTKRIGCYEGERLEVRNTLHFYCNNEYLGFARTQTTDGRAMPIFDWQNDYIPKGKAFVVGDHLESFDSRYWGFIELHSAQRLKEFF